METLFLGRGGEVLVGRSRQVEANTTIIGVILTARRISLDAELLLGDVRIGRRGCKKLLVTVLRMFGSM